MTEDELLTELLSAEQRLQNAQRAGDVDELDRLLHDRLIAIGPDGARHTKRDDLDAHRSRSSVVETLTQESLESLVIGETGVTFLVCTVTGVFGGAPLTARLRYTRTWSFTESQGWQIIAAHIAPL